MNTDILYSIYNHTRGELTSEQFQRVADYQPTDIDRTTARQALTIANLELGIEEPSDETVGVAAKLIGSLGDEIPRLTDTEQPSYFWVQMETALLQQTLVLQRSDK